MAWNSIYTQSTPTRKITSSGYSGKPNCFSDSLSPVMTQKENSNDDPYPYPDRPVPGTRRGLGIEEKRIDHGSQESSRSDATSPLYPTTHSQTLVQDGPTLTSTFMGGDPGSFDAEAAFVSAIAVLCHRHRGDLNDDGIAGRPTYLLPEFCWGGGTMARRIQVAYVWARHCDVTLLFLLPPLHLFHSPHAPLRSCPPKRGAIGPPLAVGDALMQMQADHLDKIHIIVGKESIKDWFKDVKESVSSKGN
ncbi:hypothetical protein B0H16DRAFT_1470388 [Mycena metata]|uniref:Uncharacterized protein n=1 Tax=Mycena metata TaxID=1033252 RepID=A0AAD7HUE9_9AGAR|nr:hypothetical protein B0H16DRAFT_1470388 [Mycena metata]